MRSIPQCLVLIASLALCACSPAAPPAAAPAAPADSTPVPASEVPAPALPAAAADADATVDYSCTTDADCTVKNVGNCCGYYPACVNVDSPTFPERVKAECEAQGMSSVCGFPAIESCVCRAGRCEAGPSGPLPVE